MRKSYKFKKRQKQEKKFFANYKIRAKKVSVIDEKGEQLGTMNTREAIALAEERNLDLVQVNPNAEIPVAKFMNYGNFQYKKDKIAKNQKKLTKTLDVKNIRISVKIGEHDKETRLKQAEKFLNKGHKIKIELILKGREMQFQNIAREQLQKFVEEISVEVEIEQNISKQGHKFFIILMPVKK